VTDAGHWFLRRAVWHFQAEMVDAGALQYSNQSKLLALSKETAKKVSWMDARAWKTQVTTLITYAVMCNRVAILPEIACIEYARVLLSLR
jgi:uncharacterized protein YdhG (YjbR/CyaY superfamily)